ncbi:hypothetical protein [Bdellovibrio bacteriovorus]|uniref:hypothetical protein n=1 Tax=Bdellovibrio TaxID=958 RepID=UPI0035A84140
MKHLLTLVLALTVPQFAFGEFQAPVIRTKLGMFSTTVSAGELVNNEALGAMMTLQPSVLWDFPSMNSRMGVHYIVDVGSSFGVTPISGIGVSGYYYLRGLSAAYENSPDDTLIQKSKPGFYTFASFTPVNFNLNKTDETNSNNNFAFSALVYEVMLGMGYEYPLKPNALLSVELASREGSASQGDHGLRYSGVGLFLSFTTSYY